MRKAKVSFRGTHVANFVEIERNTKYSLKYVANYRGQGVSLTLPVRELAYEFSTFPSFFEGLLPEGAQLEALLRLRKIDSKDFFAQLIATGSDLVGAVTVEEENDALPVDL